MISSFFDLSRAGAAAGAALVTSSCAATCVYVAPQTYRIKARIVAGDYLSNYLFFLSINNRSPHFALQEQVGLAARMGRRATIRTCLKGRVIKPS
jgi:hypothetical protein